MTNKTNITEARVRPFMPADGREAVLWASAAPGLGLLVRANGCKTWMEHRRGNGAAVRQTLGGRVPRRLRRTLESGDPALARGWQAPAHPARLRRAARRCGDRDGRAQLVRRLLGQAGGIGERTGRRRRGVGAQERIGRRNSFAAFSKCTRTS